jgi:hypothetical protein
MDALAEIFAFAVGRRELFTTASPEGEFKFENNEEVRALMLFFIKY